MTVSQWTIEMHCYLGSYIGEKLHVKISVATVYVWKICKIGYLMVQGLRMPVRTVPEGCSQH